ncbi:uncharacterized protein [Spinacia oleracea]|uniref:Uncharacterized protein isoform X1 n=1 Tax=Spinacia oleracea TaxID=3562 RepID=A0ABM3R178_SPIOL|nr:uncharacterized protein LOC130460034 isoform X1 [Spinacia oleracea]XP_056689370.1 uncharacterized protein LOC130464038 isoform X1 [Spinacia oleracea]
MDYGRSVSGYSQNSRMVLKCECGNDAVVRTVKHGPNVGMKFHGCPLWPNTKCIFFRWISDHNQNEELEIKMLEMEQQQHLMAEKNKKLKGKKKNLEEENQELKIELCHTRVELMKTSRNEKNFSMALLCSWVFFCILLMYLK